MFNFFEEIKKNLPQDLLLTSYNLVNLSGKLLYVEGHKGLTTLSKECIAFKVKGGRIVVEGKNMILIELTQDTMKISGQISKVEAF